MISRKLQTLGLGAVLLAASALSMQAVTVREFAIGGSETVAVSVPGYSSGAGGGIISLKAGGATQQGFCVDPFRGGRSGSAPYSFSAVQGGSKFSVGAAHAGGTDGRWTFEYTGALTGDVAAAGAAIASPCILLPSGSTHFQTADNPGAGIVLAPADAADFYTADNPGAGIVLGAGGPGNGQNPIAQAVPDAGSTLLLFGLAMLGLLGFGRYLRAGTMTAD